MKGRHQQAQGSQRHPGASTGKTMCEEVVISGSCTLVASNVREAQVAELSLDAGNCQVRLLSSL